MLIDFAGMMINTNYIISIYKTEGNNKYYEVNVKLYPSNNAIKEAYDTKKEQETRFTEIISKINRKLPGEIQNAISYAIGRLTGINETKCANILYNYFYNDIKE